jgi:hypothetical protein
MPRTVSKRMIAANRRNARKSTGPRTRAGKARSSSNSLKHGLLAKSVVVQTSPQCEADFHATLARLHADPQGFIEETLVQRIAACYWRLARVHRTEALAVHSTPAATPSDERSPQALQTRIDTFTQQITLGRRILELHAKPADQLTPEESREREAKVLEWCGPWEYAREAFRRSIHEGRMESDVRGFLADYEASIAETRQELGAAERAQALQSAHGAPNETLPARQSLLCVIPYESMLDRQLHRAIAELRRLRLRRLGRPRRKSAVRKKHARKGPFRFRGS